MFLIMGVRQRWKAEPEGGAQGKDTLANQYAWAGQQLQKCWPAYVHAHGADKHTNHCRQDATEGFP